MPLGPQQQAWPRPVPSLPPPPHSKLLIDFGKLGLLSIRDCQPWEVGRSLSVTPTLTQLSELWAWTQLFLCVCVTLDLVLFLLCAMHL